MASAEPSHLFWYLTKHAICLPIESFYRIIYADRYNEIEPTVKQARELLPGIFSKMAVDPESVTRDGTYDPKEGPIAESVKEAVHSIIHSLSQSKPHAVKRITLVSVRRIPIKAAAAAPVAEASPEASLLASEYAKYKVAFVTSSGDDSDRNTLLTVLQNYVKV
jgi:hypothetical protein